MTRIAVIGYGYWGPNVARNFQALDGCELYAVCDPDAARLDAAKGLYPAVRTVLDARDLLNDASVDAVAICTPVHTHFELAHAAIRAGKHVLVEKPLTSSVESAQELVTLAESEGVTLQVDHTFVYSAPVQSIREMIDQGALGDLLYIDSMRINLGLFRSQVGVLWDLAVHDVSIINHLIGQRPIWVSASGAAPYGNFENLAYITLMYPNQLIAHVNVNWLSPVKLRSMVIGGSEQMVVYDDLAPSEKLKVYDKGVSIVEDPRAQQNMLVDYRLGSMTAPHVARTEPLAQMCGDFVRAIETGEAPLVDGRAGLEVVRIVSAAAESLKKAGERISLSSRAG